MKFTISLPPITKKNSQRIVYAIRNHKKVPIIIPSAQYKKYENDCAVYMPKVEVIDFPVNVKAVFYMPTRRKVDLVNLQEALLDVLVKYRVLKDDCSEIVQAMDGSAVLYDKDHPRTEVSITWPNEECLQKQ